MAKRKENMLEAFQASATDDTGGREQAPLDVGGPFAPFTDPPPVSRTQERRAGPEPDLALAPVAMPFGSVTFLVLQILLLAGAFALGRLTAPRTTEAAGGQGVPEVSEPSPTLVPPSDPRTELEDPPATEPEATVDQLTDFDRAFRDPENKLTIQVLQYNRVDDWCRTLAWNAYDFLFDRGLPVVQPVASGNSLFVYVGAARDKSELTSLLERVRKTPQGASSKDTFSDALVVNIPR